MNGRLIVLEGLDGSGKATQTALLCDALAKEGKPVKQISFPDYGNPSSSLVKMYLNGSFGSKPDDVNAYAASAFYAVDRYASFKTFWQRAYSDGAMVIADRYTTSNAIYQLSKLPQEERQAFLDWLADFEYNKLQLPKPDLVLYLDMPTDISQALMSRRYHGDETKKDLHEANTDFLASCREGALFTARAWGWKVIHCAEQNEPRNIESIHREIVQTVREVL